MARIKPTKKQQEHFNQFIEKIPKSIEYLERRIQENGNELFQLSFNDEEIIVVTAFFISIIGTQEEEKLIPIIEAYIGESWRYHFDGKWALCPENKDRAFLKPVIYWGDGSPRHWPWEEIVEIMNEKNKESVLESINYSKEMLAKHKIAREILFGDFKEKKK